MLGAVMFGHRAVPAGDPGDHRTRRDLRQEPWDLPPVSLRARRDREPAARGGRAADRRGLSRAAASRSAATGSTPPRRRPASSSPTTSERALARKLFKELEKDIVRGAILRGGSRIDGRDTKTVRPIACRSRHAAARPWLGAVHPRRDPGAGRRDARHRPGRADHRRARGRVPRALHAALQFPALFDRRGGPHGLARAGARSATASSPGARCVRCCRRRRASPTRSASSRRSPNRTARPRWPRCAAPRCR